MGIRGLVHVLFCFFTISAFCAVEPRNDLPCPRLIADSEPPSPFSLAELKELFERGTEHFQRSVCGQASRVDASVKALKPEELWGELAHLRPQNTDWYFRQFLPLLTENGDGGVEAAISHSAFEALSQLTLLRPSQASLLAFLNAADSSEISARSLEPVDRALRSVMVGQ